MILKPNHEIISELNNVKDEDGQLTLIFGMNMEIELPQSAFDLTELKKYVGGKVGIMNVDGQIYRIRRIHSSYKNKLNKGEKNERNKGKQIKTATGFK